MKRRLEKINGPLFVGIRSVVVELSTWPHHKRGRDALAPRGLSGHHLAPVAEGNPADGDHPSLPRLLHRDLDVAGGMASKPSEKGAVMGTRGAKPPL